MKKILIILFLFLTFHGISQNYGVTPNINAQTLQGKDTTWIKNSIHDSISAYSKRSDMLKGISFNGTNQMAAALTCTPNSLSPNLITNGEFNSLSFGKLYHGAVFAGWQNVNDSVSGTVIVAATDSSWKDTCVRLAYAGAKSGWVRQSVTVEPSEVYCFSVMIRNDGTNPGRIGIYDLINSANIVALTVTTASTDWINYVLIFTAPAGCTSVRVDLVANPSASSWFDHVCLYKTYDFSLSFWLKRTVSSISTDRDYIVNMYTGYAPGTPLERPWNTRFIGSAESDDLNIGRFNFFISQQGTTSGSGIQSKTVFRPNEWYFVSIYYRFVSSTTNGVMSIYVNGVLETTITSATGPPLMTSTTPLSLANTSIPGSTHWSQCEIGELMLVKYDDITLSDFNPYIDYSSRTIHEPIYGGASVVAWYKFGDLTTDSSGNGHTLIITGSPTLFSVFHP